MGLNEIKLGVPLPYPADRILRQLVDDRAARRILDTGDFFPPEDTLPMGLVDEVVPLETVIDRSVERVLAIGTSSLDAFRSIKCNRTEPVVAQIQERLAKREELFIEMWYRSETREKLEEACRKF